MLPLDGPSLVDALGSGHELKVGWAWDQIDRVEVENLSGGKTFGAVVGTMALAVVVAPIVLAAGSIGGLGHHGEGGGGPSFNPLHNGRSAGTAIMFLEPGAPSPG